MKFVLYVDNNQFSDKFKYGWKKFKVADLLLFLHFTLLILPCGADNFSIFSMYLAQICSAC